MHGQPVIKTGGVVSGMSQKYTTLRVRQQERCLLLHLALENEGNTVLQNVAQQRSVTSQKDMNTLQRTYSSIR